MFKNKYGQLSILMFGVMMLLIPTTSISNAQENDRYYERIDKYIDDYEYDYEVNKDTINTKLTLTESQIVIS